MAKKASAPVSETVSIEKLTPHPQNYRKHPPDQLEHIVASIKENGIYRAVVVAKDYTILAGHGVVEAARSLEMDEIPVFKTRLAPDDPLALKILIGDNEISKLASVDDRLLSDLLKQMVDIEGFDLTGTGFDKQKLAALVMVTRTSSEIEDFDAAAEWVGMPEYDTEIKNFGVNFQFDTAEDRSALLAKLGLNESYGKTMKGGQLISMWWPIRDRDDLASLRFVPEK